jgi:hypothetical protein
LPDRGTLGDASKAFALRESNKERSQHRTPASKVRL